MFTETLTGFFATATQNVDLLRQWQFYFDISQRFEIKTETEKWGLTSCFQYPPMQCDAKSTYIQVQW